MPSLENWLELALLGLISVLLFSPPDPTDCACTTQRHIAALVILLSWTELIILVAKHPRLER